jgi:hypothetical protein
MNDNRCPICLDELSNGNQQCITKCRHSFHCDCIRAYCKIHEQCRCPLCNVILDPVDIKNKTEKRKEFPKEILTNIWADFNDENLDENLDNTTKCDNFIEEIKFLMNKEPYKNFELNEKYIKNNICRQAGGRKSHRKSSRKSSRKSHRKSSRKSHRKSSRNKKY